MFDSFIGGAHCYLHELMLFTFKMWYTRMLSLIPKKNPKVFVNVAVFPVRNLPDLNQTRNFFLKLGVKSRL